MGSGTGGAAGGSGGTGGSVADAGSEIGGPDAAISEVPNEVRDGAAMVADALSADAATFLGIATSVSAGKNSTCAVKPDGTLVCWGDDGSYCSTNGYGGGVLPAGTFTSVSVG